MYTMGDKLLSRVHYGVLVAVYSVMLLLALVTLGTFAKDEARFADLLAERCRGETVSYSCRVTEQEY